MKTILHKPDITVHFPHDNTNYYLGFEPKNLDVLQVLKVILGLRSIVFEIVLEIVWIVDLGDGELNSQRANELYSSFEQKGLEVEV